MGFYGIQMDFKGHWGIWSYFNSLYGILMDFKGIQGILSNFTSRDF